MINILQFLHFEIGSLTDLQLSMEWRLPLILLSPLSDCFLLRQVRFTIPSLYYTLISSKSLDTCMYYLSAALLSLDQPCHTNLIHMSH